MRRSEIKADFLIEYFKRLGLQFFTLEPVVENGRVVKYQLKVTIKAEEVEKLKKIA